MIKETDAAILLRGGKKRKRRRENGSGDHTISPNFSYQYKQPMQAAQSIQGSSQQTPLENRNITLPRISALMDFFSQSNQQRITLRKDALPLSSNEVGANNPKLYNNCEGLFLSSSPAPFLHGVNKGMILPQPHEVLQNLCLCEEEEEEEQEPSGESPEVNVDDNQCLDNCNKINTEQFQNFPNESVKHKCEQSSFGTMNTSQQMIADQSQKMQISQILAECYKLTQEFTSDASALLRAMNKLASTVALSQELPSSHNQAPPATTFHSSTCNNCDDASSRQCQTHSNFIAHQNSSAHSCDNLPQIVDLKSQGNPKGDLGKDGALRSSRDKLIEEVIQVKKKHFSQEKIHALNSDDTISNAKRALPHPHSETFFSAFMHHLITEEGHLHSTQKQPLGSFFDLSTPLLALIKQCRGCHYDELLYQQQQQQHQHHHHRQIRDTTSFEEGQRKADLKVLNEDVIGYNAQHHQQIQIGDKNQLMRPGFAEQNAQTDSSLGASAHPANNGTVTKKSIEWQATNITSNVPFAQSKVGERINESDTNPKSQSCVGSIHHKNRQFLESSFKKAEVTQDPSQFIANKISINNHSLYQGGGFSKSNRPNGQTFLAESAIAEETHAQNDLLHFRLAKPCEGSYLGGKSLESKDPLFDKFQKCSSLTQEIFTIQNVSDMQAAEAERALTMCSMQQTMHDQIINFANDSSAKDGDKDDPDYGNALCSKIVNTKDHIIHRAKQGGQEGVKNSISTQTDELLIELINKKDEGGGSEHKSGKTLHVIEHHQHNPRQGERSQIGARSSSLLREEYKQFLDDNKICSQRVILQSKKILPSSIIPQTTSKGQTALKNVHNISEKTFGKPQQPAAQNMPSLNRSATYINMENSLSRGGRRQQKEAGITSVDTCRLMNRVQATLERLHCSRENERNNGSFLQNIDMKRYFTKEEESANKSGGNQDVRSVLTSVEGLDHVLKTGEYSKAQWQNRQNAFDAKLQQRGQISTLSGDSAAIYSDAATDFPAAPDRDRLLSHPVHLALPTDPLLNNKISNDDRRYSGVPQNFELLMRLPKKVQDTRISNPRSVQAQGCKGVAKGLSLKALHDEDNAIHSNEIARQEGDLGKRDASSNGHTGSRIEKLSTLLAVGFEGQKTKLGEDSSIAHRKGANSSCKATSINLEHNSQSMRDDHVNNSFHASSSCALNLAGAILPKKHIPIELKGLCGQQLMVPKYSFSGKGFEEEQFVLNIKRQLEGNNLIVKGQQSQQAYPNEKEKKDPSLYKYSDSVLCNNYLYQMPSFSLKHDIDASKHPNALEKFSSTQRSLKCIQNMAALEDIDMNSETSNLKKNHYMPKSSSSSSSEMEVVAMDDGRQVAPQMQNSLLAAPEDRIVANTNQCFDQIEEFAKNLFQRDSEKSDSKHATQTKMAYSNCKQMAELIQRQSNEETDKSIIKLRIFRSPLGRINLQANQRDTTLGSAEAVRNPPNQASMRGLCLNSHNPVSQQFLFDQSNFIQPPPKNHYYSFANNQQQNQIPFPHANITEDANGVFKNSHQTATTQIGVENSLNQLAKQQKETKAPQQMPLSYLETSKDYWKLLPLGIIQFPAGLQQQERGDGLLNNRIIDNLGEIGGNSIIHQNCPLSMNNEIRNNLSKFRGDILIPGTSSSERREQFIDSSESLSHYNEEHESQEESKGEDKEPYHFSQYDKQKKLVSSLDHQRSGAQVSEKINQQEEQSLVGSRRFYSLMNGNVIKQDNPSQIYQTATQLIQSAVVEAAAPSFNSTSMLDQSSKGEQCNDRRIQLAKTPSEIFSVQRYALREMGERNKVQLSKAKYLRQGEINAQTTISHDEFNDSSQRAKKRMSKFEEKSSRPEVTSASIRIQNNQKYVRGDVKFKMLIRCVIKFFRKKGGTNGIHADEINATPLEEPILTELFTKRNYVPHKGDIVFKSFNTDFRDWIFSLPAFCRAFIIFFNESKQHMIDKAIYHYGENVREDLTSFLAGLRDKANQRKTDVCSEADLL